MKINLGMPEIFLVGSIYIYQQAFAFSMVLLGLALFGKLMSFSLELQEKKESMKAGEELTKSFMDNLMNAVTLSGIANGTKSSKGFH